MASITVMEPNKEPRTLPLGDGPMVIGRSHSKCKLAFDFLGISSTHCEIVESGETFKIIDLNSANHTFVNGRMIAEHYLNQGDRIALGVIILIFNNETQKQPAKAQSKVTPAAEPAPAAESEAFSEPTFIMDGQKLQKKMQQLRSGKIEAVDDEGEPSKVAGRKPPTGAKARDYANAVNKAEKADASSSSYEPLVRWLFFILGFFAAASLAFGLAIYLKVLNF